MWNAITVKNFQFDWKTYEEELLQNGEDYFQFSNVVIPLVQPEKSPENGMFQGIEWCHDTGKQGKGSWRKGRDTLWGHS